MNILYLNACCRKDSRTDKIARALLEKLGNYTELNLYKENLKPLDEEFLEKRTTLINQKNYDDPIFDYAKQFASADKIVVSAPHWDLSFPSVLKLYIENIYVTGIVSKYSEKGIPEGLCKAEKLYFVTTSGGPLAEDFGYNYIKSLAMNVFGIKEVSLIKAEMLDIVGAKPDEIVKNTIESIVL